MSKFFVTTSIAYTNGPPHIGFAFELILADVLARSHRQKNDEVFFLTGTDEHGQTNVRAAGQAGRAVQDFVDENARKYQDLALLLNISNDDFLRTTDKIRHHPTAQEIWKRLDEAGDIYKKKYKGLYCSGHEAYLTAKEIVNGKCPVHDIQLEEIEEENYFFRLNRHTTQVAKLIEDGELVVWPAERKREILNLLEEGVEDVSFSRPRSRLNWGVAVPGDPDHVMYVWCDALVNYLSSFADPDAGSATSGESKPTPEEIPPARKSIFETEGFKKWWPADLHVIGKDISRFHAIIWPAMLISAKLPLPKQIAVHGFITVEGRKMSKTVGNVIDPFEAQKQFGTDALRYYLLREIPATEDGDFSWTRFGERYETELANDLGNLVQRTLTLIASHKINIDPTKEEESLLHAETRIDEALHRFEHHRALEEIFRVVGDANRYIDIRKPWEERTDRAETLEHLGRVLLWLESALAPMLPETAGRIREQIQQLKPEPLFPKTGT